MGGVCSRKQSQLVEEDDSPQTPTRFSKTSSLKWLLLTLPRSSSDISRKGLGKGPGRCPTLMELCVAKVCKDISKYSTLAMLPSDLSQQIFDELVDSNCLTEESLGTFQDCALHDICMGEYPGVKDAWMEVVASQRQSLLSVDISCSEVTDSGLNFLSDCSNMQSLSCNYCDHITEHGLEVLSGFSNLTFLSFKRSDGVTAEGMRVFASLVNLANLDLERCLKIHGGLIHVKGLRKLESLNMRYCNYITDSDIKHLADLTNLKELQLSSCRITDLGISYLRGLSKLTHLNLESCPVTAACLEAISGPATLYNFPNNGLHLDFFCGKNFRSIHKVVQKTLEVKNYIQVRRPPSNDYQALERAEGTPPYLVRTTSTRAAEGAPPSSPLPHWSQANFVVVDSREVLVLRSHRTSTPE